MTKKLCKHDTDFQRSISFHRNIEVWIVGEFEAVGKIESFTDDSVKIDGYYYLRENCEFWMV
ncbi:MAG TPA: hypothetical protein VGE40_01925 [Bacilli bacterium]